MAGCTGTGVAAAAAAAVARADDDDDDDDDRKRFLKGFDNNDDTKEAALEEDWEEEAKLSLLSSAVSNPWALLIALLLMWSSFLPFCLLILRFVRFLVW